MDLLLGMVDSLAYHSKSQIARVLSERWAARELYCPACSRNEITAYTNNQPVYDFFCAGCTANFQLKAKLGRFGKKVSNSGYEKKMKAILAGQVPHYLFLSYDEAVSVTNLFVVPGFLILPHFVEKRTPLRETALRHGWIGSNILLQQIPPEGRIPIITNGSPLASEIVRAQWQKVQFLQKAPLEQRGWLATTLKVIHGLGTNEFDLADLYAQQAQFSRAYPNNKHIQPKIRQQLQILRDRGFVEFRDRGRYRLST